MKNNSEKELCDCGNVAVWCYLPGYSEGGNSYHCDECVPRGCDCNLEPRDGNFENSEKENWYMPTDEKGREFPCCEFDFSEMGYEKDENENESNEI